MSSRPWARFRSTTSRRLPISSWRRTAWSADRAFLARIVACQRLSLVARQAERPDRARRDQRRGHDLGHAGADEGLADERPRAERRRQVRGHLGVRQDRRDRLVAPDPGNLLGQVALDLQVRPPARDRGHDRVGRRTRDAQGLRLAGDRDLGGLGGRGRRDPGTFEGRTLLGSREGRAEEAVDPRRPKREPAGLGLRRCAVRATRGDARSGPFGDQAGDPIGADPGKPELLALLEAQAGLRPERVTLARSPDEDRIEDGGLDDHVSRPLGDLARCAAHDSGDRQGARGISDNQVVGSQLALDVIERLDAFPGPCPPDDQLMAGDARSIERMGRLAELEHHVVRGIDDVADRTHPGRLEPDLDRVG
jgi:hypothetical protein